MPLSTLTTIGLGGPARRLVEAGDDAEVIAAVEAADASAEPLLVIAGGSNLVIGDAGFEGMVLQVRTRGVEIERAGDRARVRAAAGEPWDELVARVVAAGLSGIEALSGIPGSTGATPIQNVGAYGQEVAQTIVSVRAYDRSEHVAVEIPAAECGFAYRSSRFRHADRHIVLAVTFELERSALARPARYGELARRLGVAAGGRAPLLEVREAVLALRRGKGMVVDPADPDSRSAGSFFVNPVLAAGEFDELRDRARARLGAAEEVPAWPEPDGRVKTSAAWLIERAGFHRGYGRGRVGLSSKHTLALVNRGGATTGELLALAREIRAGVDRAFGVRLRPEPTLIGAEL